MQPPGPPDEPLRTPVGDLIAFLGRPHMHAVLFWAAAAPDEPIRFNALLESSGVPRNTLVQRLKELVQAGLLSRTEYDEAPVRVEYAATRKLHDLVPVFVQMHHWGRTHALHAAGGKGEAQGEGRKEEPGRPT